MRKKHVFGLVFAVCVLLLSSCSDKDYLNAIPGESTVLISMDMQKLSGTNNQALLKAMLHVSNVDQCGLDLSEKLFLFESPEGDLGLCAKVKDEDDLENLFDDLSQKGLCQKPVERRGYQFTLLKGTWTVGFSDKALLVMGPTTASGFAGLSNKMAKYLGEDEEDGIKGTPIFDRLDSLDAPMAMVTQAQALPEKFIAPFTLGAPKDADPSQVYIAADMTVEKGVLTIHGETFSFNQKIDASLKRAEKTYRPIQGKYLTAMPNTALLGWFMNVEGSQFIKILQSNKSMTALLAGINAAVDMDNIIRSVKGDMAIVMPTYSDNNLSMSMAAQLGNSSWIEDVSYWKQSCPEGGKIVDWGKNAWHYTDGKTSFYFGVSPDLQFFSGSSEEEARRSIVPLPAGTAIPSTLQKQFIGKKMVMYINLKTMQGGGSSAVNAVTGMLKPLFGDIHSIVYILK